MAINLILSLNILLCCICHVFYHSKNNKLIVIFFFVYMFLKVLSNLLWLHPSRNNWNNMKIARQQLCYIIHKELIFFTSTCILQCLLEINVRCRFWKIFFLYLYYSFIYRFSWKLTSCYKSILRFYQIEFK